VDGAVESLGMMRVMVVDDEPFVLRGIERSLRARRPTWSVACVRSAGEALAVLDQGPFDVIVSDVVMPETDGVTLLHKVGMRFPEVARIAMSGQTRARDHMRAVFVVHQWLAKPCHGAAMSGTLERLRWVRSLVDDAEVSRAIASLTSLPSALQSYRAIVRALEGHPELPDLIALIETDIGLATKLLQLVNTAFFADGERVSSIPRAATILGLDRLRLLLGGAEVRFCPEAENVTRRGLFIAQLARSFAREHEDDVYLAGLLQDVAALALGPRSGDASVTFAGRASALLLGTWGLPIEVVNAVAFHGDPGAARVPGEPRLCAVALAAALAAELGDPTTPHELVEARAAALGLDGEDCRARARELQAQSHDPGIRSPTLR
jgi:HD-like signal output (HDOD) protein/ActR/RegA family two-component response regulator